MKTMKKALALVLALAIVMSLGISAFAADTDPQITVINPSKTISIVGTDNVTATKIFSLTFNKATNKYSYKPVPELSDFEYTPVPDFNPGSVSTPVTADTLEAYLQTIKTNQPALQAFAKVLSEDPIFQSLPSVSGDGVDGPTGTVLDLTGHGLGLGYYLVSVKDATQSDSTHSNLIAPSVSVSLTSTDYQPTVYVKMDAPVLDKKIKQSSGIYGDDAVTQEVGTKADFQLTSKVPNFNGYSKYTFEVHDTLSTGLKLDADSFKVQVGTVNLTAKQFVVTSGAAGAFTLHFGTSDQDMKAFVESLSSVNIGDAITITYTATITEDALTLNVENNEAYIEYSNDPTSDGKGKTPKEKVYVYEFGLNINKVDGGNGDTGLAGAVFALRDSEGDYYKYMDHDPDKINWVSDVNDATQLISKDDGTLAVYDASTDAAAVPEVVTKFKGLKAGTYQIVETKAPDGYAEMGGYIEVVINPVQAGDGTLSKATYTFTHKDYGTSAQQNIGSVDGTVSNNYQPTIKIQNFAGQKLPETGGIGTTIFYTVGAVMMAGALVLLITKKKMSVN